MGHLLRRNMFVSEYVIFYLSMKLFVKSGQNYEKTFVLRLIFIEITTKQYEYSKKAPVCKKRTKTT